MVLMSTTSVPPRCDANATGRTATDWSMEALPCQTRVGLRSFIDRQGTRRFYCSAWAHKTNVERRFGRAIFEGMEQDWEVRKARIDQAILADPERPS